MSEQKSRIFLKRGDIVWVELDPTIGTETKKKRPAIIISNDAQNKVGKRFIIAPLTSSVSKVYPFEVAIQVDGKPSKAMFDQIRTVDVLRLGDKLGSLTVVETKEVDKTLKLVLSLG